MAVLGMMVVIGAPVLAMLAGFALTRWTGVGANELFRRGLVSPRHVMDSPPVVENYQWMSLADAAQYLGLAERRLRPTVSAGVLKRATNYAGEVGVTRSSIERQLEWRRNSTKKDRARRAALTVLSALFGPYRDYRP
ncbi:MAG TPA: hypothetical protein VHB69_09230 [Mycobacteriales bacterium]|nr:hypothetical protein [Mycobacteriales bacterium]